MGPDILPPRFLSREFHTEFFPRVLKNRLGRKKREDQGTTFTSTTEMMISLTVCVILAVIGIPLAWTQGSVFGWILSIVGFGGIVGLVILSVGSQWGDRPTYDDFLIGIFLFFVSLGLFIGIPVGLDRHSFWLGLSASLAGLVGGYVLGILAGLRLQHLGWLAVILNMLAAFAAIVLGATALIILFVLVVS
jgi:membrane associated rhomboid family serine protease